MTYFYIPFIDNLYHKRMHKNKKAVLISRN
jgi:hypothetical protein